MDPIFHILSRPGGIAQVSCMGTEAPGMASLMEQKDRKFTGCDEGSVCVENMVPSLLEAFVEQMMNNGSSIMESEVVQKGTSLYMQSAKSGRSTRQRDVWQVPSGLHPVEAFLLRITGFLSQCYMDVQMLENAKHLLGTLNTVLAKS